MIGEVAAFPLRPDSNITSGDGWSILSAPEEVGKRKSSIDEDAALAASRVTFSNGSKEIDRTCEMDETSPRGKKRRLDEEQMTSLVDKTFNDSTYPPNLDRIEAPSPAQMDRFNAIRTTADVPAEGAGLRGKDVAVGEKDAESGEGSNGQPTSPLLAASNAPKKLCIRHLRMADEGTTAKLQKVSNCFSSLVGIHCSLPSSLSSTHLHGWQSEVGTLPFSLRVA